jgi:hypothetical protein
MNEQTIQDARASPRGIPVPSNSVYCSSKFRSSNSQPQDNECYLNNTLEGNYLSSFLIEFIVGYFVYRTNPGWSVLSDFSYTHASISFYLIFSK